LPAVILVEALVGRLEGTVVGAGGDGLGEFGGSEGVGVEGGDGVERIEGDEGGEGGGEEDSESGSEVKVPLSLLDKGEK